MQESPFIGRRGLADHVDRRDPCRSVGVLRRHDGVGGRQRHVLPWPLGGSQRVDRHELTGQQWDACLQTLIAEDRPAGQMGHEQRRIRAMRGGRINRDQPRSRYAGPREQGQDACLRVQQVLGVLHEERVDEGPQHQVAGASVPRADGQPPHFGGDTAVQSLGSDDPFADLQVPAHPSQCRRSDSRRLIVVGHRATPSSGRRHAQSLSLEPMPTRAVTSTVPKATAAASTCTRAVTQVAEQRTDGRREAGGVRLRP